jgi:phosphoribosyl 1,2-cyclic phosphate phosphodiesterase
MQIEILGSSGAFAIPRAGSTRAIDIEAREKGIPYARSGPSTFIHGPDILFDTPEENRDQLVRAGIRQVAACFYSHWHPDHVMGRRVWESLNHADRTWPRQHRTTDVYLPEQVAIDFRAYLGSWDHLAFLQETGLVRVHTLTDGESVTIDGNDGTNGVTITPFRLAEGYVYAFLVEDGKGSAPGTSPGSASGRVLIAMDELNGWTPPSHVSNLDLDLAILPIGVFEFHPLTGKRLIDEADPVLREEATFAETVAIARALDAHEVVFSHIEALDELGHDDLVLVAKQLRGDGLPATIAYDGLRIDVSSHPAEGITS